MMELKSAKQKSNPAGLGGQCTTNEEQDLAASHETTDITLKASSNTWFCHAEQSL